MTYRLGFFAGLLALGAFLAAIELRRRFPTVPTVPAARRFEDFGGQSWHISTAAIDVRDSTCGHFERRAAMHPVRWGERGEMGVATYLGDYPQYADGRGPTGCASPQLHAALVISVSSLIMASSAPSLLRSSFDAVNFL